jgi:hypothetical protein
MAKMENARKAIWSWLWPPEGMKLRREEFLRNRESVTEEDFLRHVDIKDPLASAVAIAFRNTIAIACSVPPDKLHPSDSIDDLRSIVDWGCPFLGWLNDDNLADPVDFPNQFERELSNILPGFSYRVLSRDWFDRLPHFDTFHLGVFRRRKFAINLGQWLTEAVAVVQKGMETKAGGA